MSNTFGFSFLKPEHREQTSGSPCKSPSSTPSWLGGRSGSGLSTFISGTGSGGEGEGHHGVNLSKSPLVAQATVLNYLKNRTVRTPVTAMEIESETGVALMGKDAAVMELLRANPKIEIHNENDDDKHVTFEFFAKYNVANKQELLFLVNRCTSGVSNSELQDLYVNCEEDMKWAIQSGEVIAIKHKEHNTVLLYPRGEKFLTELSGTVSIEPRSKMATTTEPLSIELRRGEAVRLGKQWVRVSSEVGTLSMRSMPPESVTSDKDMSSRNVYLYDFSPDHLQLPLNTAYLGAERWEGRAVRHGCGQRMRKLWRESLSQIPKDLEEVNAMLFAAGLTSKARDNVRPPKRIGVLPEQRKSQRDRKKMRQAISNAAKLTNQHLEGTYIGLLLEQARLHPEVYRDPRFLYAFFS